MPRRRQPEQIIQRAVVDHLAWRARPGLWWTHVPLGGWRTKIEAAILKGLGARRGTPDLLLAYAGRLYALELKASGGRLSPAQRECHSDLQRAGVQVAIARGIDEAIRILESWQLLRPARSA